MLNGVSFKTKLDAHTINALGGMFCAETLSAFFNVAENNDEALSRDEKSGISFR